MNAVKFKTFEITSHRIENGTHFFSGISSSGKTYNGLIRPDGTGKCSCLARVWCHHLTTMKRASEECNQKEHIKQATDPYAADPWKNPNYNPWKGLTSEQRIDAFYEEFYRPFPASYY